ncbi:nitrite reductase small subunit NirD [Bacillus siamensis]|uniref:nitrite reductase small subunit NirD n=1 Tax=Bacillus TaxID=1386 RepID=UPI0002F1D682|nr:MULTISPECIES: nitrite reductase small subunit NirD [Bacillus]MDU0813728.1 nitrite reductase small subunit NirD [Bacillus siamensis]MED5049187.1 nitrite reductase small subunit NirD [Bacillus siamensis]MED5097560.1 nitrite reductase small subunit NirD [Bacillus siamensis]
MVNKDMTKVCIGRLNELPEELGKTVYIEEKELAVFKLSDGSVRAVENRCPHKGGVLAEGIVSGEYVFCPMHDWKISLEDGKVQEPDHGCIKTYETLIEGENVYLLY